MTGDALRETDKRRIEMMILSLNAPSTASARPARRSAV
jgi:hypothetical protein